MVNLFSVLLFKKLIFPHFLRDFEVSIQLSTSVSLPLPLTFLECVYAG